MAMAAGMAAQGMVPVFAVYSSFLQRGFDMLLHDVGLMQLHVVFAVDRAGLVGEDGETHHGVFDVGYLSQLPGIRIYCPASFAEMRAMLERAVLEDSGPVAVRYARGGEGAYKGLSCGASECCREGKDFTLVSYGVLFNELLTAADLLGGKRNFGRNHKAQHHCSAGMWMPLRLRWKKPGDSWFWKTAWKTAA